MNTSPNAKPHYDDGLPECNCKGVITHEDRCRRGQAIKTRISKAMKRQEAERTD